MPSTVSELVCQTIQRYEERAAATLLPAAYEYIVGGAGEEISLNEATAAWRSLRLRPHALRDVSNVDTSTTLLGARVAMPVLVAPTGFQVVCHPEGEVQTARGVAAAGGLMIVATRSSCRLEAVAAALGGPWWFQVYFMRDCGLTRELVLRAAAAGATALVLTGDTPYVGAKRRGAGAPITDEQYLTNLAGHLPAGADVDEVTAQDPSVTLDAIGWLAELSGLPVLVKGVLRGDDAVACLDAGAAGVVVSNHGGRQLDRSVPPAVALPEVVSAIGGRGEVLVDGGVRSGEDVMVALALGARAVLVGRPVLWALAAEGATGVENVLSGYREHLAHVMALAGATSVREVGRDLIAGP
jgi:4-hydroxymandelate oxidase